MTTRLLRRLRGFVWVTALLAPVSAAAQGATCPGGLMSIHGVVTGQQGSELSVKTRAGVVVRFNVAAAQAAGRYRPLVVGMPVAVLAATLEDGTLSAQSVARAKSGRQAWAPDCPP